MFFLLTNPSPTSIQGTPLCRGHFPWSRVCPLKRGSTIGSKYLFFRKEQFCNFFFKVAVTYPNKQPAKNVPMLISAHGRKGFVRIHLSINTRGFTDENGEVKVIIDSCSNCDSISIQVEKYGSS